MHTRDISPWKHEHDFSADTTSAEKRTHKVILLTVFMMVVEIVAGMTSHSMALLADGWHMSTHAAAFVIDHSGHGLCGGRTSLKTAPGAGIKNRLRLYTMGALA